MATVVGPPLVVGSPRATSNSPNANNMNLTRLGTINVYEVGDAENTVVANDPGAANAILMHGHQSTLHHQHGLEKIRRNGNFAIACSIVCFFTGCCNWCANCLMVPWLAIAGQKSLSLPDDLDRRQCCCLCIDGRAPQNVRHWTNLSMCGMVVWLLALLLTSVHGKWVLDYPEMVCEHEDRWSCYECVKFDLASRSAQGEEGGAPHVTKGTYVFPPNSLGNCVVGPGLLPRDDIAPMRQGTTLITGPTEPNGREPAVLFSTYAEISPKEELSSSAKSSSNVSSQTQTLASSSADGAPPPSSSRSLEVLDAEPTSSSSAEAEDVGDGPIVRHYYLNNCYHEEFGELQKETQFPRKYLCPFFMENANMIERLRSESGRTYYYDPKRNRWVQPVRFTYQCTDRESRKENGKSCKEVCDCLGGTATKTENQLRMESYAIFALVLNLISILSVPVLCVGLYHTRRVLVSVERGWRVLKEANPGGRSGYDINYSASPDGRNIRFHAYADRSNSNPNLPVAVGIPQTSSNNEAPGAPGRAAALSSSSNTLLTGSASGNHNNVVSPATGGIAAGFVIPSGRAVTTGSAPLSGAAAAAAAAGVVLRRSDGGDGRQQLSGVHMGFPVPAGGQHSAGREGGTSSMGVNVSERARISTVIASFSTQQRISEQFQASNNTAARSRPTSPQAGHQSRDNDLGPPTTTTTTSATGGATIGTPLAAAENSAGDVVGASSGMPAGRAAIQQATRASAHEMGALGPRHSNYNMENNMNIANHASTSRHFLGDISPREASNSRYEAESGAGSQDQRDSRASSVARVSGIMPLLSEHVPVQQDREDGPPVRVLLLELDREMDTEARRARRILNSLQIKRSTRTHLHSPARNSILIF